MAPSAFPSTVRLLLVLVLLVLLVLRSTGSCSTNIVRDCITVNRIDLASSDSTPWGLGREIVEVAAVVSARLFEEEISEVMLE